MSDANGVLKTFVSNSVVFSSLALIVYDTSLTFSREVKCIWKRKFSAVTVLYVLQRYVVIAALVAKLPWSSSQFPVFTGIQAAYWTYAMSTILNMISTALTSLLRVWAIYQQRWLPVIFIVPLALSSPCINIYHFTGVRHFTIPGGLCDADWYRPAIEDIIFPPLTRAAVITTDILIVFFIWYKTVDSWTLRDIRFKGASGPLLTTVLIQNGTIYFVVLTALNIVTLVMDKVPTVGVYGGLYSYVGSAISANLSARFFLDLRMVYFQRADPNFPTMASSVRFAGASIIGNIGAPMSFEDSAWVMSAGLEAEERPVYSDDPIMAHPAISAVDLGGGDDADVAREGA